MTGQIVGDLEHPVLGNFVFVVLCFNDDIMCGIVCAHVVPEAILGKLEK